MMVYRTPLALYIWPLKTGHTASVACGMLDVIVVVVRKTDSVVAEVIVSVVEEVIVSVVA